MVVNLDNLKREQVQPRVSWAKQPTSWGLDSLNYFSDWNQTSSSRPILHVQLGDITLPVFREEGWESFTDVAKAVEKTAVRFGGKISHRNGWMQDKDWEAGESLLCVGRVLLWKTDTEAALGTLVISDRRCCFLPIDGSGKGRLEWRVPGVQAVDRDDADVAQLVIREEKRELLLTPVAGPEFCEAVREALLNASQFSIEASLDQGHPVSAILGEACSIRVFHQGELLTEIKQGQILGLDQGNSFLGLVHPGVPTIRMEDNPVLRFEARKWDAIYQFEAEVSGIHRCPKYIEEQLGRRAFVVAFFAPLGIRRFNRRQAFRVKLVQPLSIQVQAEEQSIQEAKVVDLSTDGCAMITTQTLRKGRQVEVMIPFGKTRLRLKASICNVSSVDKEEGTWRYGMRFNGVSASGLDALQEMVMRYQRDLLSDVADRRVFL